jgi:hypothetical protein
MDGRQFRPFRNNKSKRREDDVYIQKTKSSSQQPPTPCHAQYVIITRSRILKDVT